MESRKEIRKTMQRSQVFNNVLQLCGVLWSGGKEIVYVLKGFRYTWEGCGGVLHGAVKVYTVHW